MYLHNLSARIALVLICAALTQSLEAAPFCALRDPIESVYELFPGSTGYRSIVRRVEPSIRETIASAVPFTVHAREIGKHTLYVALQDAAPLGYLHARTEESQWGMMEITWALGLDLSIQGLNFQRCRDPGCQKLLDTRFLEVLDGRRLDQLVGTDFEQTAASIMTEAGIPAGDHDLQVLVVAILKSAIKTQIITADVWADVVAENASTGDS